MRTYLNCPFSEKDEAKALGARWDAAKKRWYVQDAADLQAFSRWLPDANTAGAAPPSGPARTAPPSGPARTGPAQLAAHCGCDVLPWEPCIHSPALPEGTAGAGALAAGRGGSSGRP